MIVSRETQGAFATYLNLLQKWNAHISLVSSGDAVSLQDRHIQDCYQLVDFANNKLGTWLDLGSGGGLPGMVVAISRQSEDLRVVLVESDKRKAAFLQSVIREVRLRNCTVLSKRIEELPCLNADYISARALASLSKLLEYVDHHMKADGTAFLMKGKKWQEEVSNARLEWNFDCEAYPSRTSPGSAILEIKRVSHAAL